MIPAPAFQPRDSNQMSNFWRHQPCEECQLSTRKPWRIRSTFRSDGHIAMLQTAKLSILFRILGKNLVIAIELSLRISCKSRCAGSQRSLKNPFRFDSSESSSTPMNWQILADVFVNLNDQQVCKFQMDPKIRRF